MEEFGRPVHPVLQSVLTLEDDIKNDIKDSIKL
jgi:hypothetical protein